MPYQLGDGPKSGTTGIRTQKNASAFAPDSGAESVGDQIGAAIQGVLGRSTTSLTNAGWTGFEPASPSYAEKNSVPSHPTEVWAPEIKSWRSGVVSPKEVSGVPFAPGASRRIKELNPRAFTPGTVFKTACRPSGAILQHTIELNCLRSKAEYAVRALPTELPASLLAERDSNP